jgi:type IV pilus assembly protein PilP
MTHWSEKSRAAQLLIPALLLTALAGCAPKHQDIAQWMDQQRKSVVARVPPIIKPTPFVPAAYDQADVPLDPFESKRLLDVFKAQDDDSNNALLVEAQKHTREPLEAFPLSSMVMMGSINQLGHKVALIKVNNLIHQVKVGNYMGQDYGKIINITETKVVLREIARDSTGEWTERETELQLQESQERGR